MNKINFKLLILSLVFIGMYSCQKDDSNVKVTPTAEIFFTASMPTTTLNKKSVTEPTPTDCADVLTNDQIKYAHITYLVEGALTEETFTSEVHINKNYNEVDQNAVDQIVTKEALKLPVGEVEITSFYITQGADPTPVLAIPVVGSIYSTFVNKPLVQTITVEDGVRKAYEEFEILCITLEDEPKFGLRYFDLAVIRTMPLCVLGNICNEEAIHEEAEFMLNVWKYTGDCDDPKATEFPIVSSHNFDPDPAGFGDENGELEDEEDYDALLCTYLPDRTDMPNEEFWVEIWVYDPDSPLAIDDDTNDYYGYYVVEAGVLTEEEIKDKWEEADNTNGSDNNYFHFQVNKSDNCSMEKKMLTIDCNESIFYYSIGKSKFSAIYKFVPGTVSGVYEHGWSTVTDDNSVQLAYNTDIPYKKVLYVMDKKNENLKMYLNDAGETSLINLDVKGWLLKPSEISQATYADGYLYLGDDKYDKIYAFATDPATGYVVDAAPIEKLNNVDINDGDMVVVEIAEQKYLRSINKDGSVMDYMINADGSLEDGVVSTSSVLNKIAGAAVVDGRVLISTLTDVKSFDGTEDVNPHIINAIKLSLGIKGLFSFPMDMASSSILVE